MDKKKRNNKHTFARRILVFLGFCLLCFFVFFSSMLVFEISNLPYVKNNSYYFFDNKSTVYSDDGDSTLSEIYYPHHENMSITEELGDNITTCVIGNEDRQFYEHNGVVVGAFARAFVNTIKNGSVQGGSTITMQAVKSTLLNKSSTINTVFRKASEVYLAIQLEKSYSKDEILHIYLNNADYANGIYGIKTAADYYFCKSPKDLTLSEAAFLTTIPQYPSKRNPLLNFDDALAGRNIILKSLLDGNYITPEEYDQAINEAVNIKRFDFYFNGEFSTFSLCNEILIKEARQGPLLSAKQIYSKAQNGRSAPNNDQLYISLPDVVNFFDSQLYYDSSANIYVTSHNDKYCCIDNLSHNISINGRAVSERVAISNNTLYFPVSILPDIYGVNVNCTTEGSHVKIEVCNYQPERTNYEGVNYSVTRDIDSTKGTRSFIKECAKTIYEKPQEVFSPTTMELSDNGISIKNGVDFAMYKQEYSEIWPCVELSQNASINALSNITCNWSARQKTVQDICSYAKNKNVTGIMIDFRYVNKTDRDYFTRFVKDLKAGLSALGCKLIICVACPDGAANISQGYDYVALSKICNYMNLRAYNESVEENMDPYTNSGYNWIYSSLDKLINRENIPKGQILLDLPKNMNCWIRISSTDNWHLKKINQEQLDEFLNKNTGSFRKFEQTWQEAERQFLIICTDHKYRQYQIWVENNDSLQEKTGLCKEFNLCGLSY